MLQRQSHALTVAVSVVNAFRSRLNSLLRSAGVMRDAVRQIIPVMIKLVSLYKCTHVHLCKHARIYIFICTKNSQNDKNKTNKNINEARSKNKTNNYNFCK